MKIALVVEHLDPSRGGKETSTAQLAAELAGRGEQVTIFTQTANWSHPGVAIRTLGIRGLLKVRRLGNFVRGVERAVQSDGYDVVHAMLPLPVADVYQLRGGCLPAQRLAKLRSAGRPESTAPARRLPLSAHNYLLKLERRCMADSRMFLLPVSKMGADELQRFYGRLDVGVGGDYDDLALLLATGELPGQIDSVSVRQVLVQKKKIEFIKGKELLGLLA